MKTNSLVLSVVAVAVLGACGTGTNQNPLSNYQRSQALQPSDGQIQVNTPQVEYVTKEVPRVDKVIEYRYALAPNDFFQTMAPSQFQFVVGRPTTFPIRIRGLVGQLKYEVAVESATLRQIKLENVKVEGNDVTADLTFTASSSDIQGGQVVGLGDVALKMTILEIKHENATTEGLLKAKAQAMGGAQKVTVPYVVLPSGTAAAPVNVPAGVKGDNT